MANLTSKFEVFPYTI